MAKEIIFHIGIGKTGTTSLQDALERNRDALLEQGVLYPVAGILEGTGAHHLIAEVDRPGPSETARWLFDNLQQEIDQSSAMRVVISSENCSHLAPTYIRWIADRLAAYDLSVVFYVREQVALVYSSYLQWFRMSRLTQDVRGFYTFNRHAFDFLQRIEPWAGIAPASRIRCRLYGHGGVTDVVSDFFSHLGVEGQPGSARRLNPSLHPDFIPLMLQLNRSPIDDAARLQIMNLVEAASLSLRERKEFRDIDPEFAATVRADYFQRNVEFGRRYLPDEQATALLA